jgi:hypothetical protein
MPDMYMIRAEFWLWSQGAVVGTAEGPDSKFLEFRP